MFDPIKFYRVARWLYLKRVPLLPRVITLASELIFHCYLPPTAQLGRGCAVGYRGVGVVVHSRAWLGDNVFLGPGVVIGGKSEVYEVPRIHANTYIAAGAKILGDIELGKGCVVGANAVVLRSAPPHSVLVGVPARVLRENADVRKLTGWPVESIIDEQVAETF
jgi:serine O-acetyltransferase